MGKIILIRHGETSKNVKMALHAFGDPEGLNDKGKKQITAATKRIKKYEPTKIYFSKERRAMESAKIISTILKIPAVETQGFEERNWGIYTGRSWEDVIKILDPMTPEERFNFTPKGGESWKTFETRLIEALKKVSDKNEIVAVVTHGGAIRALIPYLLGVPRSESFRYDPDNASITIFDFDGEGYHKVLLNDTSHI